MPGIKKESSSKFLSMDLDPLWCSWFSGLVDGEGCFYLDPQSDSKSVGVCFTISFRADDTKILEHIRDTILCGNIYHMSSKGYRDKTGYMRSDSSKFVIGRVNDHIDFTIPFFDSYPLKTKKKFDYDLWRVGAKMVANGDHLNNSGRKRIIEIRDEMKFIRGYRTGAAKDTRWTEGLSL